MKPFSIIAALLLSACCLHAAPHGAVSTQYQHLDPHSHTYSYGYSDPNSQKHETRSHDGTTHGSYSYVDGHGHLQSVSYTADPHKGFHAVGTNLPDAKLAHSGGTYAAEHGYQAPYHGPLAKIYLTPAGVPHDTPEVEHAKQAHLAALAEAKARAGHGDYSDHGGYEDHGGYDDYGGYGFHGIHKRSLYGGGWGYAPALTHGGVPVDTPEVQHAKAAHFAAHAKARSGLAHAASSISHSIQSAHPGHSYASGAHGYHVPVIHNGVPVETPEVQHAKAAHFAALAEAKARAGPSDGHYDDGHYDGSWDKGYSGSYGGGSYDGGSYGGGHYGGGYSAGHKGPIHIPVIHNGVPVEPIEVQHARAAHLSAVAAASHGPHGGHGGYYGGHHY